MEKEKLYLPEPMIFMEKSLKVNLHDSQKKLVWDIWDKDKVVAPWPLNIGKTFVHICLTLWYLNQYENSKVITILQTSNFKKYIRSQVNNILSNSIFNNYSVTEEYELNDKLYNRWVVFSQEEVLKSHYLNGIHEEHLMIIIDEPKEIIKELFDIIGSASCCVGNKILYIGVPDHKRSIFHKLCCGELEGFAENHITAFNSPNISFNSMDSINSNIIKTYDKLISIETINRLIRTFGINSDFVKSKVFAEFV